MEMETMNGLMWCHVVDNIFPLSASRLNYLPVFKGRVV